MRMFTLASGAARKNVDLRDYEDIIIKAITDIIPNAKVKVFEDCYVIDKVTKGESIKIGRKLASTKLCTYCIKISKLFSGEEISKKFIELLENEKEQLLEMNRYGSSLFLCL